MKRQRTRNEQRARAFISAEREGEMCHVLIIEDDVLIAMQIEALLSDHGARSTEVAATELDAVKLARARKPGFITADVRLKVGTGPRAVAQIAKLYGAIPTIFITGTPSECSPCDAPHRIHEKPIDERKLALAFKEMAPLEN